MELGDIELNTRRYQSGAGGACLRLALGDSNWVILAAFVLGVSTAKLARRPIGMDVGLPKRQCVAVSSMVAIANR